MNMEYSRGGYTASNFRRQDVGNKRSALRPVFSLSDWSMNLAISLDKGGIISEA